MKASYALCAIHSMSRYAQQRNGNIFSVSMKLSRTMSNMALAAVPLLRIPPYFFAP